MLWVRHRTSCVHRTWLVNRTLGARPIWLVHRTLLRSVNTEASCVAQFMH